MQKYRTLTSPVAIILGAFLLVEGIWGFFTPVVFGGLTTNLLHAVIHTVLGITGLYMGMNHRARGYCLFVGGLLLTVGVLRFVPLVGELIVSLLNVNQNVATLNILLGLFSLGLGLAERPLRAADDDINLDRGPVVVKHRPMTHRVR